MAERRTLPRLMNSTQKFVLTLTNILKYCNEIVDYSDSFVYGETDVIRMRLFELKSHTIRGRDDAEARIAIFTNDDDNSYYAAIEVDGEWCEFTLLNSTKDCDTVRFNKTTHHHFYADEYILRECGTPISNMLIGMMSNSRHIGEDVVYSTINLAKEQGLL